LTKGFKCSCYTLELLEFRIQATEAYSSLELIKAKHRISKLSVVEGEIGHSDIDICMWYLFHMILRSTPTVRNVARVKMLSRIHKDALFVCELAGR
jgi:hypothetical protein